MNKTQKLTRFPDNHYSSTPSYTCLSNNANFFDNNIPLLCNL